MQDKEQGDQRRAVRHAEKRRTSTCAFADRIAQLSVDHYHMVVPESFRHEQKQTCVATIVAHHGLTKELRVIAMGVGTKFLSNSLLAGESASSQYGDRVRDCHAEVLARRALRRYLSLQILNDRKVKKPDAQKDPFGMVILEKSQFTEDADNNTTTKLPLYKLNPHITLHCYTSSAPCGNAVLKRFVTCRKEVFRDDLGPDEWPTCHHEDIPGHAISQGEFSLLLKEDKGHVISSEEQIALEKRKMELLSPKQQSWPSNCETNWCPAGTTTLFSGKGSLHTCSDKLLRWNILGWQGSLLSSFLEKSIVPETLTVGRKLSAITCRRAVCCRAVGSYALKRSKCDHRAKQIRNDNGSNISSVCNNDGTIIDKITVKHPVIMGTSVYLDEEGVVETDPDNPGQDVRFHSSLSFAWWLGTEELPTITSITNGSLECIDGATGWALDATAVDKGQSGYTDCGQEVENKFVSSVSTTALVNIFLSIHPNTTPLKEEYDDSERTLGKLREMKLRYGGDYERRKAAYFAEHEVLRTWNRRHLL
jgi:double-stranded RNA-specific adenosine deaminase